jgi:hypothetical protein
MGSVPRIHPEFLGSDLRDSIIFRPTERLSLDKEEGKVYCRYGKGAKEQERMDYLEFIARVTSHIPDKGQVMVRYYGLC